MAPKLKQSLPSEPIVEAPLSTTTPSDTAPVFFWREYSHPQAHLSQWYSLPFRVPNHPTHPTTIFHTAEQYMMFSKALLFSDPPIANKILSAKNPREQKKFGRAVKNFDEVKWKEAREEIVETGCFWKFGYQEDGKEKGEGGKWGLGKEVQEDRERIRGLLLGTGERELVEASPYDWIWGVGFKEADAEERREEWGENLLGECLMRVRERLRKGEGDEVVVGVETEVDESAEERKS